MRESSLSLHPDLIGAWRLERFWYAWPDGRELEPLGECKGQLHYMANGYMSVQLVSCERQPLGMAPTDDQLVAAFREGFAYCGRWQWDSEREEVCHHLSLATIADWDEVTLMRRVTLEGDRLLLGTDAPNPQLPEGGFLTWLEWHRLATV
ncbi:MAG: hypothetical protein CL809_12190 [Cobetia sp.]|uniref:lipocalin-like domain-containing protein n=1 Tax=Cobetia sp. TaxID=1873876 RepID=UPI000C49C545|nr:lipocalin-like domain-containing protein [Cobetia sp.]MBF09635.1 hypothetical protein [Cobetia sp.]HBJ27509.1 hypothetical protein [Cobetia sp.]|tara:strand:+ start:2913 stop:3362 length:450 start_codon:yes stop_codon:yes gene_type:complete